MRFVAYFKCKSRLDFRTYYWGIFEKKRLWYSLERHKWTLSNFVLCNQLHYSLGCEIKTLFFYLKYQNIPSNPITIWRRSTRIRSEFEKKKCFLKWTKSVRFQEKNDKKAKEYAFIYLLCSVNRCVRHI